MQNVSFSRNRMTMLIFWLVGYGAGFLLEEGFHRKLISGRAFMNICLTSAISMASVSLLLINNRVDSMFHDLAPEVYETAKESGFFLVAGFFLSNAVTVNSTLSFFLMSLPLRFKTRGLIAAVSFSVSTFIMDRTKFFVSDTRVDEEAVAMVNQP